MKDHFGSDRECLIVAQKLPYEKCRYNIDAFDSEESAILIATNGYCRGLDIQNLKALVHFDVPSLSDALDSNAYLHNIGRIGRNGEKAVAFNLVFPNQIEPLADI